jgi:hypothetical protein
MNKLSAHDMPDRLKRFLELLPTREAHAIWDWLDSNPKAIEEMIAVVASSRKVKTP